MSDKWRTKATQILSYYGERAVGHTHQMIHGLSPKGRVIVATGQQRIALEEQLSHEQGPFPRSIHSLEDLSTMAGPSGPLAIDHLALCQLLSGLIEESKQWEAVAAGYCAQLAETKALVRRYFATYDKWVVHESLGEPDRFDLFQVLKDTREQLYPKDLAVRIARGEEVS